RDLTPLVDDLVREGRPLVGVDDRIDGTAVVDLIGGHGRGIRGARSSVGEYLEFQSGLGHTRGENLRNARELITDGALNVWPLGIRGILRRIEWIKGDMTRAARDPDQKRWLDRAVGETADAEVAVLRIGRKLLSEAIPIAEAPVDCQPALAVEARIRKLANAERTRGGA